MKNRVLLFFSTLCAVALVIVGAAETLQARAGVDEIMFGFGDECQAMCAEEYIEAMLACAELRGRERSMCRKEAQAVSRACLEACPD